MITVLALFTFVTAVPIVASRMAATKWSTPDVYDDD